MVKSQQRHQLLRKQRYDVARNLGASWQRAQFACQGGTRFVTVLEELGVDPAPYLHLYTRPNRQIGPVKPKADRRIQRYARLRASGLGAIEACEGSQSEGAAQRVLEART